MLVPARTVSRVVELFTAIVRSVGFGGDVAGSGCIVLMGKAASRALLNGASDRSGGSGVNSANSTRHFESLFVLRFAEDVVEAALGRRFR